MLSARLEILDGKEKKILHNKKIVVNETTEDGDHRALVAAHSRALAELSQRIAIAIKDPPQ